MFLGVSLFVNCYLPRFSAYPNSETPGLLKAKNKNTKNFNFFLTKASLFAIISLAVADVAHPVERHLAKVEVASSSLVIRSINSLCLWQRLFLFLSKYSTTSKIKKEKAPAKASAFSGATGRTRTGDLLITNQLLYQLSHSSRKNQQLIYYKRDFAFLQELFPILLTVEKIFLRRASAALASGFLLCYNIRTSARSEAGYRSRFRFWRPGVRIPPGGPKTASIQCLPFLLLHSYLFTFHWYSSNNSSGGRDFSRRRSFCCFIYFTNAEYIVFIVRS